MADRVPNQNWVGTASGLVRFLVILAGLHLAAAGVKVSRSGLNCWNQTGIKHTAAISDLGFWAHTLVGIRSYYSARHQFAGNWHGSGVNQDITGCSW